MTTEVQTPPALVTGTVPAPQSLVEPKKSLPVVWWAVLGVICAGVGIYAMGAWIVSGDAQRIDTGVTPVPDFMRIAGDVHQAIYAIAIPLIIYLFVIRQRRRAGRLTTDGLIVLAMFFVIWQDPAFNYLSVSATYNSTMFNLGSWSQHIPGSIAPTAGRVAEPLPWSLGFYVVLVPLLIAGAVGGMTRARKRWPRVSTAKLMFGVFAGVAVADFIFEATWTHLGLYSYAGVIPGLALWEGHYYQFPLYEPILVGLSGIAFASFKWFTNDKGETLAERGLDELRVGTRAKSWVRLFAMVGAMGLVYMSYNFAIAMAQLHTDRWPEDVQKRSYFMNGLCGEGTSFACASHDVAIPKIGGSIHIGPDGRVVRPPGTPKLEIVPFSRTE